MEIMEIRLVDGLWKGEATVRFLRSEPAFEGHFPHAPILPGVVLIDGAVELVSRMLNRPLRLAHLASVKFSNVVEPDQIVCFSFGAEPDPACPQRIKATGSWIRAGTKVAELKFTAMEEGGRDGPPA